MLLICYGTAFAGGQSEEDKLFVRAEQQFAAREYDAALETLSRFMLAFPEEFDRAQELTARIMGLKSGYTERLSSALGLLERGDEEGAFAMIEDLERDFPIEVRNDVDSLRRLLAVAVRRLEFGRLMDEARGKLNQGDYRGAIEVYLTGFVFHQDEFETAGHPDLTIDSARDAIRSVTDSANDFMGLVGDFLEHNEDLRAIPPEELNDALAAQVEKLTLLNSLIEVAVGAGEVLVTQKGLVTDSGSRFFLSYSDQVIRGRLDEKGENRDTDEGLAAAELAFLKTGTAQTVEALKDAVESGREAAEVKYASEEWEAAIEAYAGVQVFTDAYMRMAYQVETASQLAGEYSPWQSDQLIVDQRLREFMVAQQWLVENEGYTILAGQHLALERDDTIPSLTDAIVTVDDLASKWEPYLRRLSSEFPSMQAERLPTEAGQAVRLWQERLLATFGPRLKELEPRLAEQEILLAEGEPFEGNAEDMRPYPQRRRPELSKISEEVVSLEGQLAAALASSGDPSRFAAAATAVRQVQAGLSQLRVDAEAMRERAQTAREEAKGAVIEADGLTGRGDRQLQRARQFLNSLRYEDARDAVRLASEAYDRSLELMEVEQTRRKRDIQLAALQAGINEAEQNRVVNEVRKLLNDALAAYRRGDLEGAERVLLEAKRRWEDTNTQANQEIETLLALVRQALELQQGWELDETQPGYREIMDLLRVANDAYNRGQVFDIRNDPASARAEYAKATDSLETILFMEPRLKTANTLELRITRQTKPSEFNRLLAAAKNQAQTAGQSDWGAVFEDLKTFEAVVPEDRDLPAWVLEYEYRLGIKPRPISEAQKAESRRLTSEPQRIYDNRQRDFYERALELVNEALRIWPDNPQARILKDRILLDRGGTKVDLIPKAAQDQVRRSEQLFNDGKFLEAAGVVLGLLRQYPNYPPLLDLAEKLRNRGWLQ